MIIDTSAILAILLGESDAGRYEGARVWRRFDRGNHLAGLNFGDRFAYALAEATDEPLLFKGRDFARTDIAAALAPEANNSTG